MPRHREIIETIEMIHLENLDVRTVTMGISLWECAGNRDLGDNIRKNIHVKAAGLVSACENLEQKYGISIVNKRIAISPIALIAANQSVDQMVKHYKEGHDKNTSN